MSIEHCVRPVTHQRFNSVFIRGFGMNLKNEPGTLKDLKTHGYSFTQTSTCIHTQTEQHVFVLSSQQTRADEDANTPSFGHSSPISPFLSSSIHPSLSRLTSSTNLVFHFFSHLNSSPFLSLSQEKHTHESVKR